MKKKIISVALEHRFFRCENKVYTKLSFSYLYWIDYLSYFDEVKVIARVQDVDKIDSSYKRVDGDKVSFFSMPYYVGITQFLFKIPSLIYNSHIATKESEVLLLRSGNISNLIWFFALIHRRSYLREYPGNIKEGILGFGGTNLVNRMLAIGLNYIAKIQAKYSKANSYVSEYCKSLYPSKNNSYIFSSFNSDEIKIRKEIIENNKFRLISVGRLEGEKGHRDLIESLSLLDLNVELLIIGDGSKKVSLENDAKKSGLNVRFLGAITDRKLLFELLASSDIFVIPSHTEGMPRALLEAMAIGLPCLGTSVGGIPEVLDEKMLFLPHNPKSCSLKIKKLLLDNKLMVSQSKRNISFIDDNYSKKALDERKIAFWSELYL